MIVPVSKPVIWVELGIFLRLLRLRLGYNIDYSYDASQRELFCSRLVGSHTVFQKRLCRCDLFVVTRLSLVRFRILSFTINRLWNPYRSDNRPHQQAYDMC